MSRKIEDLTLRMQQKARLFEFKMKEAMAIPFMFTSTYRSQEEQDAIYSQGRTTPGKIVTWTHHSRHTERDAFDIALLFQGLYAPFSNSSRYKSTNLIWLSILPCNIL